jgi:hypothetical protein
VDRARLAVIGHSEGALFALLLATGAGGPTPPVHAVGLIEPLSVRYLDLLSDQLAVQIAAAEAAGQLSAAAGAALSTEVSTIVSSLRTNGTLPPKVPADLSSLFSPATSLFLSQADRYDPAVLAAKLAAHTPVLVTCSNDDIEVTCAEVDHLVSGLSASDLDFVHLSGVDHVLKVDASRTGADYGKDLPFSPQLRTALRGFVARYL